MSFCLFQVPNTCFSYPGMKLPSRTPTHLDSEDEQKWNHTDEPTSGGRCCACPKTDNQLKRELAEIEYRKTFENYLHNEVFESRYTSWVVELSWIEQITETQEHSSSHFFLTVTLLL